MSGSGEWERCPHRKDDGQRCGSRTGLNEETGLCLWHDPEREDERRYVQSQGGKATARSRQPDGELTEDDLPGGPPTTAADARMWCAWGVWAAASGKIDPKRAHEIGYLARAFLKALETAELGDEIEELREKIEELQEDASEPWR